MQQQQQQQFVPMQGSNDQQLMLNAQHFHEHENYLNDLQQQMQFYRQRLEKHQQLQHQLQQHQAATQLQQQQQPSALPAQTIDINTVNKIMNFLTGPHANVLQQLQQQQQQPCLGGVGGEGAEFATDPAGQDLSAMAQEQDQQQQQQQLEDQILEQQAMGEDRMGAQGESDDEQQQQQQGGALPAMDDEEEDEDEERVKETTDADSQTQNLSSSSESDEQINPQWDEKMWRTVAHRPNHPFQKKAQQVTQQKALGEEESIDNDTIAGKWRRRCCCCCWKRGKWVFGYQRLVVYLVARVELSLVELKKRRRRRRS